MVGQNQWLGSLLFCTGLKTRHWHRVKEMWCKACKENNAVLLTVLEPGRPPIAPGSTGREARIKYLMQQGGFFSWSHLHTEWG